MTFNSRITTNGAIEEEEAETDTNKVQNNER
jgi:hypothetical protein